MKNHKARSIILTVALVILAILQVSFLSPLFKPFHTPQIVLLALFAWIIIKGYDTMIPYIIIGGVLIDIFTFQPIGVGPFSFLAILFFAEKIAKRNVFLVDKTGIGSFATFGLAAIISVIYSLTAFLVDSKTINIIHAPWVAIIIGSFYSALSFVLLYFAINKLEHRLSFYDKKITPLR